MSVAICIVLVCLTDHHTVAHRSYHQTDPVPDLQTDLQLLALQLLQFLLLECQLFQVMRFDLHLDLIHEYLLLTTNLHDRALQLLKLYISRRELRSRRVQQSAPFQPRQQVDRLEMLAKPGQIIALTDSMIIESPFSANIGSTVQ